VLTNMIAIVRQCQIAEVDPERIGCDIGNEDGVTYVGRGCTRAYGRTDDDAVDGVAIGFRQTRRGSMQQAPSFLVQEQDGRTDVLAGCLLDLQQIPIEIRFELWS
jgi:hypothetical protein